MDAVATVIGRVDQVRVGAAAHDLVEIDYAIELCLRADPFVDFIANFGFGIVPAGVVRVRIAIMPRDDGDADHLYALGLDTGDDALHPGDDFTRPHFPANIVRAHEQYNVAHAGVR